MNQVSDISSESRVQRVIRDHALAALMLTLAMVTLINGIVIGIGIATINTQGERYDRLKQYYDETSIYVRNLHADLKAHGYEPLPAPKEAR